MLLTSPPEVGQADSATILKFEFDYTDKSRLELAKIHSETQLRGLFPK